MTWIDPNGIYGMSGKDLLGVQMAMYDLRAIATVYGSCSDTDRERSFKDLLDEISHVVGLMGDMRFVPIAEVD